MKLTTVTNITVDAVMQGLGGRDEDRRNGFKRGGWAMPFFDEEVESHLGRLYLRADAFLLGRWTYEVFAGSWGSGTWGTNAGNNPISTALNTHPKYVVSNTLTNPAWEGTTVLSGDTLTAVRELKAAHTGELQVHGSLSVVRWLFAHDLVDEVTLLVYPVVLGQGECLFPAAGPDTALNLMDARRTRNGVMVQVFQPDGRPAYGAAAAGASSQQPPPRS